MEGLEKDSREEINASGLIRSRCCRAVVEENPVRRHGPCIHWRESGGGDAMVLCKLTRGLPILSEENF